MKIFVLSAQKGGKGKSLMTSLIANSLAIDFNKRVLVIDGDEQGTISDVRKTDSQYVDPEEFPYELVHLPISKVEGQIGFPDTNKTVIEFLDEIDRSKYDVVFVDMQGSISDDDLIEVLMEAHYVLLPVVAQQSDIYSDQRYIKTIKRIEEYKLKEQDPDFKLYAALNRKKGWIEEKQMEEFCKEIGVDLFKSALRDLAVYSRFNTYESYMSSDSRDVDRVREEFSAFMNELVAKYNL